MQFEIQIKGMLSLIRLQTNLLQKTNRELHPPKTVLNRCNEAIRY